MEIGDHVTVLRDGRYVDEADVKDIELSWIVTNMVGENKGYARKARKIDLEKQPVALKVDHMKLPKQGGGWLLDDVSFEVKKGEIFGIYGLLGAGRSELVEGIFGMKPLAGGEIYVKGKKVKVSSPQDIIKEGVALITEDRKVTGLNLSGTVNDNIAMVAIKKLLTRGLYNKRKALNASQEYIEKLNIKTPSGNQIVGNLSGGNQQKVVIAKWLLNEPDIIILDEPTRGIDVGAKRDIYLLLGNLVKQGKAVIMISSEIPELMGICDRIVVMCEGNYSGEVKREDFSQERIMTLASAIKV